MSGLPRLRIALAWLALAAALLLATAPSISRWIQATSVIATAAAEPCHDEVAPTGHHGMAAEQPAADPLPWAPGEHCGYCALAAHTPGVASFHIDFAGEILHAPAPWIMQAPRLRDAANRRGLGSQGPPARA